MSTLSATLTARLAESLAALKNTEATIGAHCKPAVRELTPRLMDESPSTTDYDDRDEPAWGTVWTRRLTVGGEFA